MNQTLSRDDLVEKMNLGGVPTDVQDQIIAQYGENVLKAVTIEIMSLLSPEERVEFEKLINTSKTKEMEEFLKGKVSDLDGIIKGKSDEIIERVKAAMNS